MEANYILKFHLKYGNATPFLKICPKFTKKENSG